jgi:hypothetical protein
MYAMYTITNETNWIIHPSKPFSWDIPHKKGYKYYDPINHKFYISRDVTF